MRTDILFEKLEQHFKSTHLKLNMEAVQNWNNKYN